MKKSLIVMDVCIAFLVALFAVVIGMEGMPSSEMPAAAGAPAIFLLLVVIWCHVGYVQALKQKDVLQKLPPQILEAVGAECMTGMQAGNAILCKSGCLLVINTTGGFGVNRKLELIFPRDMVWIYEGKFGLAQTINVLDRWKKPHTIIKNGIKVRGNGTFQKVEMEAFYHALSKATPHALHEDTQENRELIYKEFDRMVHRVDEGYQNAGA